MYGINMNITLALLSLQFIKSLFTIKKMVLVFNSKAGNNNIISILCKYKAQFSKKKNHIIVH